MPANGRWASLEGQFHAKLATKLPLNLCQRDFEAIFHVIIYKDWQPVA